MKKIILCLLFGLSFNASANCYKELCSDDVVRDVYGWKGSVVSFNEANETVDVFLHHNGYTFTFPYAELGKQVRCFGQYCEGQELKDQYGSDIIVFEVYTHKMLYAFNLNIDGYALYNFNELP